MNANTNSAVPAIAEILKGLEPVSSTEAWKLSTSVDM